MLLVSSCSTMSKHLPSSVSRLIQQAVKAKLSESTINTLLSLTTSAPLSLYGECAIEDATWVFLYWILKYPSYKKLQDLTTIPHSNYKQIFGALRSVLYPWAEGKLSSGSFEERQSISQKCIAYPEMQDITLIVDGTQCRIWTPRDKEERQENTSYKFQQLYALCKGLISVALDICQKYHCLCGTYDFNGGIHNTHIGYNILVFKILKKKGNKITLPHTTSILDGSHCGDQYGSLARMPGVPLHIIGSLHVSMSLFCGNLLALRTAIWCLCALLHTNLAQRQRLCLCLFPFLLATSFVLFFLFASSCFICTFIMWRTFDDHGGISC